MYLNHYYGEIYEQKDSVDINDDVNDSHSNIEDVYKRFVGKIISVLVLHVEAEENMDENMVEAIDLGRGDSPENSWYSKETYPGNNIKLRMAMHEYTIRKLNIEGHLKGSFQMWTLPDEVAPHAHNIFLIFGYDFGIPTMILMFFMFIVTLLAGIYNMIRFQKAEYLLPVLLIAGMTVFGWFDSGFHYKSGMFVWIVLCVVYTDVLHMKKKEVE